MGALDVLGKLRYGKDTAEKEADAARGDLPYAPKDNTAELKRANRYASGYHFAKRWPRVSKLLQPVIDRIKTSDLPVIGGESPEDQSYADAGANAARMNLKEKEKPGLTKLAPAYKAKKNPVI